MTITLPAHPAGIIMHMRASLRNMIDAWDGARNLLDADLADNLSMAVEDFSSILDDAQNRTDGCLVGHWGTPAGASGLLEAFGADMPATRNFDPERGVTWEQIQRSRNTSKSPAPQ